MLLNIIVGCALMIVTTVIHAGCMLITIRLFRWRQTGRRAPKTLWSNEALVASIVVMLFLASVIEATAWAACYLVLGAISGVEKALYFSMVTFTTLGYGDITLHEQWRLLASFEAASGIIMFGWTTAMIIAVARSLYVKSMADDGQS